MALLKIKRKGEKKAERADEAAFLPLAKDLIGISDAAASHIAGLAQSKNQSHLRIAIRGGGCSGMSIHYEMIDNLRDGDVIFAKNPSKVAIDKKSLSILGGSTLHCRDYLGAKEFVLLNNPAHKQCSCGQSFSL